MTVCIKWLMKWGLAGLMAVLTSAVAATSDETREIQGVTFKGSFQQGGMVIATLPKGASAKLGKRILPVSPDGKVVFGFGRDQGKQTTFTMIKSNGQTVPIPLTVAAREYDIQKITGVPPRTVNPDPKHLARIQKEAGQVANAREINSKQNGFLQSFIWPVKGPITGVYGSQRVFNGEPRRPHFGVDIAAAKGTDIVAPAPGVVTMAHPNLFFSGATMVIDHGYGISTSYLHMSKMTVAEGDTVKQGDVIGLVGATGRATGPHLCWRLNWYQERLDPQLLVPALD